ncbi:MAG: hypothetical protein NPIRA01_37800 [Nitrospirales bacterium]|nr:MAG: hypothetical protein NPIRA01_37800 [Nitrospirales bacterium]
MKWGQSQACLKLSLDGDHGTGLIEGSRIVQSEASLSLETYERVGNSCEMMLRSQIDEMASFSREFSIFIIYRPFTVQFDI